MPLARGVLARLVALLACAAAACAAAQAIVATVPVPGDRADVAVDSTRNLVYVATGSANAVGILDGATRQASVVPVGRRPQFVAVNTVTNRIYASNTDDATLSVIDGATRAVATLPIGGAGPIVVNERTNKVYVMRRGNNGEITVVDGATNSWYTMDTGSYGPWWMALDPAANRLYVSHSASGDVRVIDLNSTSDHPPSLSVPIPGSPNWLAFDPRANKVYAQTSDASYPVVAIDGATLATTRIAVRDGLGPVGITVNPATGRVYAGFNIHVAVIDGATNTATGYVTVTNASHLLADPATNRIFALLDGHHVAVIDGATNVFTALQLPVTSGGLALNPATHLVYTAAVSIIDAGAPYSQPVSHGDFQGLWWGAPAGSESGWGVDVAQQGDKVFAAWFTYDAAGQASWFVLPDGQWQGSGNVWSGTLYRVTGPSYSAANFDPSGVATQAVGGLLVNFFDGNNGEMRASVDGLDVYKRITRQVFATPVPTCDFSATAGAQPNYTDLWWKSPAGSESGWGLFVTHQADTLFIVWYTYDTNGKALWFVGSNMVRTGNGVYSGPLYRTFGPPFNASPWDKSKVTVTGAGSATLTFTDNSSGVFAYNVNGLSGSKTITRQLFSTPATVCR